MKAKNWYHAANVVWRILVQAASNQKTVSYSEIAPAINSNPLSVRLALEPIQYYCIENKLPPLTSIVIGKNTSIPGKGFIGWDVDDLATAHAQVFNKNWAAEQNPFEGFGPEDTIETIAEDLFLNPQRSIEIYVKVKVRGMGQILFRNLLLKAYDYQCAFCGINFQAVLEACHIIPWEHSSPSQRLDPKNGILLCATHHRLFDSGLITVTQRLKIHFYDEKMEEGEYSQVEKALTAKLHGKTMILPEKKDLHPSSVFLAKRHEIDGWGVLK